jgi:hypothetical protein
VPNKDRTFSDKDIIRFTLKNLTREEKLGVLAFFGLGDIEAVIPVPKIGELRKKIVSTKRTLKRLAKELGAINSLVEAASLLPGPQQKVLDGVGKVLTASLTILSITDSFLGED